MKKAFIAGGVLVVVLIAAVVILYSNLNSIVKMAIEKGGTEVTQVAVGLHNVDLDPANGNGLLKGLKISNPSGFDTPHAFFMNEVKMDLDVNTITNDVIVINEIVVDGPSLNYEWKQAGSNFDVLQRNILTSGSKSESTEGSGSGGGSKSSSKSPKLMVKKFILSNANVSLSSPLMKGKKIEKTLPTIQLNDIGNSGGGVTPHQLANLIMKKVLGESAKFAKEGLMENVRDLAKEKAKAELAKVKAKAKKEVKEKGLKEAKKALKGLF